jgi:carboxyl-terminal processing protease
VSKILVKRALPVIMVIFIIFSQGVFAEETASGDASSSELTMEYLQSVLDMIKDKYSGEITDEQLIEGALKGIFTTMDDYTTYYTLDEYSSFDSSLSGNYEGIGVELLQSGEYVIVSRVFAGYPAEAAGLIEGDKIASVNGISIVGATPQDAASLIMGDAGTKVTLGIIRNSQEEVLMIEITRSSIKLDPVKYEIRDGVGYIKLETFNLNASFYMAAALTELDAAGITKIILDLRDNPGGYVDAAVNVAQYFVPEGLITKLDFKSEAEADREYKSSLKKLKYDLAVLVNGNSASASEILAGAIQDTGAGTLVGTKSFGKAQVQDVFPILTPEAFEKYQQQVGEKVVDAYELITKYKIQLLSSEIMGYTKITTGIYITPSGKIIDENGLIPDIEVDDPEAVNGVNIRSIERLSVTSKPSLGSEGKDVYNAEKILALLGYDVDTPDMLMDQKMVDAVWEFRVDSGFYQGGVLDFTTQNELNRRFDELIKEYDGQYQKAFETLTAE